MQREEPLSNTQLEAIQEAAGSIEHGKIEIEIRYGKMYMLNALKRIAYGEDGEPEPPKKKK